MGDRDSASDLSKQRGGVAMTVILKEAHDRRLRKVARKHFIIHGLGTLSMVIALMFPWMSRLENDLIRATYDVVKTHLVDLQSRYILLEVLRNKPLTIGQALDVADVVMTQEEVPVSLVLGLIDVESGFNPNAVSDRGAKGLIQVKAINHRSLLSIHDPVVNLTAGLKYLYSMKESYGTWEEALRVYNEGPKNVDNKALDPYVWLVMARSEKYRKGME